MAKVDVIIPYTEYGRHPVSALQGITAKIGVPARSRIEIPEETPYPLFLQYVDALIEYDVLCRENGVGAEIARMRSIKDADEIGTIEKACKITDLIIDLIEKQVKNGKIKTETDVAPADRAGSPHRRRPKGPGSRRLQPDPRGVSASMPFRPIPPEPFPPPACRSSISASSLTATRAT